MTTTERIYLDHAATTPIASNAKKAMVEALTAWANPSSPHADGRKARALLEQARRTIGELLGWRHDVILTSGATEAIAIAAERAKVERRVVSPTEHDAVISAMGGGAELVRIDRNGIVELEALEDQLQGEPALVAVQLVNNETGVIQPVDRIYEIVRSSGSLLLCDCAQAAGKMPLPDADFIAVSAHKLGGPPGMGALLVKDLDRIEPSGGQERGYRRGTENLPAAMAMAEALSGRHFEEAMGRLAALRQHLELELAESGAIVIAADAPRIATIGAYAMPGVPSASQLVQLDLAGVSVSAGSACSSGSMKPSRVLLSMGVDEDLASCSIRLSFGPSTNREDVDRLILEWRKISNGSKARAA